MRHTKTVEKPAETRTVTYPARTETVYDYTACDLCGQRIDRDQNSFDIDEVRVAHRTGSQYPGGGDHTTVAYDVCGECFDNKLVPWMKAQGAEPTSDEVDW